MAAMIEAGEFIESADVHGNYYGTSKQAVSSVLEQGKICVLDIDVQGVQSVKVHVEIGYQTLLRMLHINVSYELCCTR